MITSGLLCPGPGAFFKRLAFTLLAILLAGCDTPGIDRLMELCVKEGFPKVYQRVSAAGYYDDTDECGFTTMYLVDRDYEFVECRQTRKTPGGLEPFGYYRISKVLQSSGQCHPILWEDINEHIFAYKKFLDAGLCFSAEAIDAPTAQYGLFNGKSSVTRIWNIFGTKIAERPMYIKDTRNDEMVAQKSSFILIPTPGLRFSSFERMLGCHNVVPEIAGVPPLNATQKYIIPTTPRKELSYGNNREPLSGSPLR
jgi:hypothetical protein